MHKNINHTQTKINGCIVEVMDFNSFLVTSTDKEATKKVDKLGRVRPSTYSYEKKQPKKIKFSTADSVTENEDTELNNNFEMKYNEQK